MYLVKPCSEHNMCDDDDRHSYVTINKTTIHLSDCAYFSHSYFNVFIRIESLQLSRLHSKIALQIFCRVNRMSSHFLWSCVNCKFSRNIVIEGKRGRERERDDGTGWKVKKIPFKWCNLCYSLRSLYNVFYSSLTMSISIPFKYQKNKNEHQRSSISLSWLCAVTFDWNVYEESKIIITHDDAKQSRAEQNISFKSFEYLIGWISSRQTERTKKMKTMKE